MGCQSGHLHEQTKILPSSRDRSKSGRINEFRICISHVLGEEMCLFILSVLKSGPLNHRKSILMFGLFEETARALCLFTMAGM